MADHFMELCQMYKSVCVCVCEGEKRIPNAWNKPSSSALNDIKNKRAQNKHPIDMKYSNIFKRGNTKFLYSINEKKRRTF